MFHRLVIVMALAAALSGCGPSPMADNWTPPRPLGDNLETWRPRDAAAQPPAAPAQPSAALTLDEALSLALLHNPELAVHAWDVRAAEARALAASIYPNPELEIEAEELARGEAGNAFDGVETTVRLTQPILTAGKLRLRRAEAAHGRDLAAWDYEARRLDVFTQVVERFVDVLAQQRSVDVLQSTFDLSQQVQSTVSQQVAAGAVISVQRTRAQVEESTAKIDLARAKRSLAAARDALAATWGADAATFDHAVGDLEQVRPAPSVDALAALIADTPDVARWATEMAQRQAAIDLAEAEAKPDVTAGAGVTYYDEGDVAAGVLSLSFPLPLFDRNQGGILEARIDKGKARSEQRAATVRTRAALNQAYHQLRAAYEAVLTLRDETLPGAQSAYGDLRRGYKQGSFELLDVLDAQRTLFEVEQRYIDALRDYHHAAAAVERLIGRTIESVENLQ